MNITSRFALRSFAGKPLRFFLVEKEDLATATPVVVKKPSHHIIVIDRSGSMYGDLDSLKQTIEKLLTLTEFNDEAQRISLISYSSQGDVKLHFAKVTVADVMKVGSPYLQEIRSIHVTGLTCISQSLALAETLVDDNEVTCISLHTDGYANDRSPSQEVRDIQAAVGKLKKHTGLFINTIAYRNWCDFNLLSSIANQGSGACFQAGTIKQVYEALYNAQGTLGCNLAPAVEAPIGQGSYVVFLSTKAKKILGSADTLLAKGLKADDDKVLFRYQEVDEATYSASSAPDNDITAPLAYARAMISEGNLNAAKYALVASRVKNVLVANYRALVTDEVAKLAADLEGVLWGNYAVIVDDDFGLGQTKANVLQVLNVLNTHSRHIRVNLDALSKNYKRRGLKRVAGVRKDDGSLEGPKFKLQTPREQTAVEVSGFDINRNTATINMLTVQKASLINCETGEEVGEVAGVKLDGLKDFKNYTIIGDGQVCTPVLPIRISDKRCFKALVGLGVVSGDFDPAAEYSINLGDLPVVNFDQSFSIDRDSIETLSRLTALSKILSAVTKEASEAYTAEQVAALKEHYLSAALYFSGPTTNDYTDLKEALNKGQVDTRLSYKVEIGTPTITNLGKIPSANTFLERRFTLTIDGQEVAKPKLTEFLNPKAVWGIKTLSARTKLTPVDDLLFPIFENFLGLGNSAPRSSLAFFAGLLALDQVEIEEVVTRKRTGDEAVEILGKLRRAVDDAIERTYAETISPLVFYVGSTGLVPDEFGAKALTAEQIRQKFSDISLSKDEQEGTFFVLPGDLLLTVYVKGEYFTVSASA